ncbi:MAG: hypothetical protein RI922_1620 [Bacteroidota bacterium]|jgi:DNA-binding HxlR family transcriptional regulator
MEILDHITREQGAIIVGDVLDIIGGKWRGLILAKLCEKPRRFNELKGEMKSITSSTLTKELRYLEELKIVERKIVQAAPVVIEYSLSEHGSTIRELMHDVISWGLKHRMVVFEK